MTDIIGLLNNIDTIYKRKQLIEDLVIQKNKLDPFDIIFEKEISDNEIWYYSIGSYCDGESEEQKLCLFQQFPSFLRNINNYRVHIVLIDIKFGSFQETFNRTKKNFENILGQMSKVENNNYFKWKNYNIYIINTFFAFTQKFKKHILNVEEKGGINIMVNFVKLRNPSDPDALKFNPYFNNPIIPKDSDILNFFLDKNAKTQRLLLEWTGYAKETYNYTTTSYLSQYLVGHDSALTMQLLKIGLKSITIFNQSIQENKTNFFVIPFTNKEFKRDDDGHFNELAIRYIKIMEDKENLVISYALYESVSQYAKLMDEKGLSKN